MNFTEEQKHEAIEFSKFYVNLLENHLDQLDLYLTDNVVLDWFGQTVKGRQNVFTFLRSTKHTFVHNLNAAQPCKSIGFRDSHNIKITEKNTNEILALPINSVKDIYKTPPSCSKTIEQGQGDGPHNSILVSPPQGSSKKECSTIELPSEDLKYISSTGFMEFQKTSHKKFQKSNRWNRPCCLEIGYTSKKFAECEIYVIIYSANMPCRRNLMSDFMQYSESDDSKAE